MKDFNFIRVTLTVVTVCSIATFIGVWKVLYIHNRTIARGASNDLGFTQIIKDMDQTDRNCQDRLKIIELENKIIKEQLETLF